MTETTFADNCMYWKAQVDPAVDVDFELDESNPAEVLKGIECLMKLEGKKSQGLFGGATGDNVSQLIPPASVEVCALYYVSYLFFEDWKHANGVALISADGRFNTGDATKKAFHSYRAWFKMVKKLGLSKARKLRLDPLANTNVRWY
jgi:hypothetical protein